MSTAAVAQSKSAAGARRYTLADLTANSIVLAHESADEYTALARTLLDEHHPASDHEFFLVRQMLLSRWRMQRIEQLEQHYLEGTLFGKAGQNPAFSPQEALIERMSGELARVFSNFEKLLAAATRAYYRAHRELTSARKTQAATAARQSARQRHDTERQVLTMIQDPAPPPDVPAPHAGSRLGHDSLPGQPPRDCLLAPAS